MKMIAAVKYARADRELKPARPYGEGAKAFYNNLGAEAADKRKPDHLIVVMSSDRGLCGGIHSSLSKAVKHDMELDSHKGANVKMILCGEKTKGQLGRYFPNNVLMHATDIGKRPLTFDDATVLAQAILDSGFNFGQGDIYFNRFKSVVSYQVTKLPIFSQNSITENEKLSLYDSLDNDVIQSYLEYSLASLIYYAMKEGSTSEQSARMTAMDAATKNAGDMIERLTMTFNRTRQAVITRELIEIISGAEAL